MAEHASPQDSPTPHLRLVRGDETPHRRRRPWRNPDPISQLEVELAFDGNDNFPPVMTIDQAAKLLQLKKSTLYKAVSQGRFKNCVRRGKSLRFFRDRLVVEFFQGG